MSIVYPAWTSFGTRKNGILGNERCGSPLAMLRPAEANASWLLKVIQLQWDTMGYNASTSLPSNADLLVPPSIVTRASANLTKSYPILHDTKH